MESTVLQNLQFHLVSALHFRGNYTFLPNVGKVLADFDTNGTKSQIQLQSQSRNNLLTKRESYI